MPNISEFEDQLNIGPSLCDGTGYISVPAAFSLCMDMASMHVDALNVGYWDLKEKDQFWMIVKTRIHIYEKPKFGDIIDGYTCVERASGVSTIRDYLFKGDNGTLIAGKSEWVAVNTKTGKFVHNKELYPEGFEIKPSVFTEAFERPHSQSTEALGTYLVKSTDIDVGHHMNNVAYIRAFTSLFSSEEWLGLGYNVFEVHYKHQAFEGETLHFSKEVIDEKLISIISNEKGQEIGIIIAFAER